MSKLTILVLNQTTKKEQHQTPRLIILHVLKTMFLPMVV